MRKASTKAVGGGVGGDKQVGHDEGSQPSERHRRAVTALKDMFRLWPKESVLWLYQATGRMSGPPDIQEARWIEQAPRGPAYVVPPPRKKPEPADSPEERLMQTFTRAVLEDAERSNGKVKIEKIDFDFEEATRQTLVEGGADVEVCLRIPMGNKAGSRQALFGVIPAPEDEPGWKMPQRVLSNLSWQLAAYQYMPALKEETAPYPCISMPLYLWPGTGLLDPQENCAVFTGELDLPGLLGALLKSADRAGAERCYANMKRLMRLLEFDVLRRDAAAQRKELMGKAGITKKQLASLVPKVDIENDTITMLHQYDIVRLWEKTFEGLLTSLPPGCLGLALFGFRTPDVSNMHALERCAFTLRRVLHAQPEISQQRAALSLMALGSVFVEPEDVKRLFKQMKLFVEA